MTKKKSFFRNHFPTCVYDDLGALECDKNDKMEPTDDNMNLMNPDDLEGYNDVQDNNFNIQADDKEKVIPREQFPTHIHDAHVVLECDNNANFLKKIETTDDNVKLMSTDEFEYSKDVQDDYCNNQTDEQEKDICRKQIPTCVYDALIALECDNNTYLLEKTEATNENVNMKITDADEGYSELQDNYFNNQVEEQGKINDLSDLTCVFDDLSTLECSINAFLLDKIETTDEIVNLMTNDEFEGYRQMQDNYFNQVEEEKKVICRQHLPICVYDAFVALEYANSAYFFRKN